VLTLPGDRPDLSGVPGRPVAAGRRVNPALAASPAARAGWAARGPASVSPYARCCGPHPSTSESSAAAHPSAAVAQGVSVEDGERLLNATLSTRPRSLRGRALPRGALRYGRGSPRRSGSLLTYLEPETCGAAGRARAKTALVPMGTLARLRSRPILYESGRGSSGRRQMQTSILFLSAWWARCAAEALWDDPLRPRRRGRADRRCLMSHATSGTRSPPPARVWCRRPGLPGLLVPRLPRHHHPGLQTVTLVTV